VLSTTLGCGIYTNNKMENGGASAMAPHVKAALF
jgi:hypothetical protein